MLLVGGMQRNATNQYVMRPDVPRFAHGHCACVTMHKVEMKKQAVHAKAKPSCQYMPIWLHISSAIFDFIDVEKPRLDTFLCRDLT